MGRVGRRSSLRALEMAYDLGITLYDTARSYGFGESEAVVGHFLQGRRDKLTVSTKFGIVAAESNPFKRLLKPAARFVFSRSPSIKRAMRHQISRQLTFPGFSAREMRKSLEVSLRALRTDYVDIFFVHVPPIEVFSQVELFEELDATLKEGIVRYLGIATDAKGISAAIDSKIRNIKIFQSAVNLWDDSPLIAMASNLEQSQFALIANQPFGGGSGVTLLKKELAVLAKSLDAPLGIKEKLEDCDDAVAADVAINSVLAHSQVSAVICSMHQRDHIRNNTRASDQSRFSQGELNAIQEFLRTGQWRSTCLSI
jgi:aryl-alcohol dehydrogenase-like predicted oxidoreductase